MPYSIHVSVSFNVEHFLSLCFVTLAFLKHTGQLLCKIFLNLCLTDAYSWLYQVMNFWQEYYKNDIVFSSVHTIRRHMLFIQIVVMVTWIICLACYLPVFYYNITMFPFIVNAYLVGKYFETM